MRNYTAIIKEATKRATAAVVPPAFARLIAQRMSATKCTKLEAIRWAAINHPDAHAEFRNLSAEEQHKHL
ncbi:MAG: hypothetical protein JNJ82_15390 [Opitutaceae bacterium]|nr:hypothetical protein [Opitutaceae bacterium]